MLRKDAEPDWENRTAEHTKAFGTPKIRLISPPILALLKAGLPYMVHTDASAYQLGATLLQQQEEDKPNYWRPIGYWSKTLTDTERNYSTTERECYYVIWSVTTLCSYTEGLTFTVRTDHNALSWLMTISDSTGRLMRWRLRLTELDFTVKYRPGLVHQVPDGLSRVLSRDGHDDKPIEDELPTYGDHEGVFISTGRKAANITPTQLAITARERTTQKRKTRTPTDSERINTKGNSDLTDEERLLTDFQQNDIDHNTTNDDKAIEDVLDKDLDIFDVAIAYQGDGRDFSIVDIPVRLTKDELLGAQSTDDFCQTVLSRQSKDLDTHFFEGKDGLLRRLHPTDPEIVQIELPDTLRPRVLDLSHHTLLAGHPGQTRMHRNIREKYYWPQMATDIYKTIRNCTTCAKNRVKLRKRTHPRRIFPAIRPLESLAIDIIGALTKTKKGRRFILVVSERVMILRS